MDHGRVQQIGSPTEIYHRPQNIFVAQFIGESNLFAAQVDKTDNTGTRFVTADGLEFLSPVRTDLSAGTRVSLLLRPENFELVDSDAGELLHPNYHALHGRLLQEVFSGSDYHLLVQTAGAGNTTIKVTVRDAARERLSAIQPGAPVTLQYPQQRLHVLTA
jgi:ABC-type Fe3+/spermidine/putrescine transport system ATPase subunit